jgi:hypothetical protein
MHTLPIVNITHLNRLAGEEEEEEEEAGWILESCSTKVKMTISSLDIPRTQIQKDMVQSRPILAYRAQPITLSHKPPHF